jgi:hypothetical protein
VVYVPPVTAAVSVRLGGSRAGPLAGVDALPAHRHLMTAGARAGLLRAQHGEPSCSGRRVKAGTGRVGPFSHGQWLAGHIPGVEAQTFDDERHATVRENHIGDVHAWLADRPLVLRVRSCFTV